MAKITKKAVMDFFKMEKERYGDLSEYSIETLVWSFLSGMSPRECVGMELEEDMDKETKRLYYDTEDIIYTLHREGKM